MILSMTGYGEAQQAVDGVNYALEIRSVNNRYLKTIIKLPEHLQFLEPEVEKVLRQRMHRGTVTYVLRLRNSSAAAAYEINRAALEHYVGQMRQVQLPAGMTGNLDLAAVLLLPGVCQPPEQDDEARAAAWSTIERLTATALERLVEMRRAEGEALRDDLLAHCRRIRQVVQDIAQRAPQVVADYQQKLRDRVGQLIRDAKLEVDKDTLLREVAVYADRCDISEELARLNSHLEQFEKLCSSPELAGRKLDFLAQELLREANTVGSKSNDAAITRDVVEIKGSIDRLKEQVQNVE